MGASPSTIRSSLPASLLWVAGAVIALIGVELLLRALPSPTATLSGYYIDPNILSYPSGHRWRVATGWDLRNPQALSANNLGFPASRDFVPDANAVVLVGDSYVEASMLSAADRPGEQLERRLGTSRPVYAMGGPGSSLLDYAERIRYARERLAVRDVVVLMEAGDVRQSVCGSGNVHSSCLDARTFQPREERRLPPTVIVQVLRKSALVQYFAGQLKISVRSLMAATFRRSVPGLAPTAPQPAPAPAAELGRVAVVDAVTRTFVERQSPTGPGRLVLVVDGQRAPGRPIDPALAAERRQFMALARAAGFSVIDAEPLFADHWRSSARSLDVGPHDAHLNAVGVGLVMEAAAAALRQERVRP